MEAAVIFDLWDTLTEPEAQAGRDRSTAEVGALLGAAARLGLRSIQLRSAVPRPDAEPWDGESIADLQSLSEQSRAVAGTSPEQRRG